MIIFLLWIYTYYDNITKLYYININLNTYIVKLKQYIVMAVSIQY